mmetsp:Transcript_48249/g.134698  ORF Transcript_48249/g.134698 Transcript_48249/m.134698 type:complete len:350 (+) Transcript_48249:142-1191(+)|eukprot:CAMPEP_0117565878 /NCGR_PEP_ID=MMETSP0784-20121206/56800_1 /TAXON_ID=39447 /ORGANISM="" /LENGTH=349 /DNA_ID=CAMNT_0005363695 /DNA_START=119 /DNA_END=1168 /DNA_ORIENTATION=-
MVWLQGLSHYIFGDCSTHPLNAEKAKEWNLRDIHRCCSAVGCTDGPMDESEAIASPDVVAHPWSRSKDLGCFDSSWAFSKDQPDLDPEMVLERALQSFTESMQAGIQVDVLMDDGGLLDVEVSLDFDVTRLILRLREVEREIPLDDIVQVCGPDTLGEKAAIPNTMHINERCATLMLSTTHFLTFSFDTERWRDYFETCLRALLAARRDRCGGVVPSGAPLPAARKAPRAMKRAAARRQVLDSLPKIPNISASTLETDVHMRGVTNKTSSSGDDRQSVTHRTTSSYGDDHSVIPRHSLSEKALIASKAASSSSTQRDVEALAGDAGGACEREHGGCEAHPSGGSPTRLE